MLTQCTDSPRAAVACDIADYSRYYHHAAEFLTAEALVQLVNCSSSGVGVAEKDTVAAFKFRKLAPDANEPTDFSM